MKHGHLPWAKKEETSKEVDLQTLFDYNWTSSVQELTISCQSWFPTGPLLSETEAKVSLSLDSIVAL